MGSVINFKEKIEADEKCSFCNKPKREVKHLFGEPGGKLICDRCVGHCNQLLEKHKDNNE